MLPNVWSIEEFKKKSNKIFSSRSSSLVMIDNALMRAHTLDPNSDAGTKALLDLMEAIANWRKTKIGKISGRARAVDTLVSQLAPLCEKVYKRQIGAANIREQQRSHDMVRQGFQQFMQKPLTVPPKPTIPTPPPLPPVAIPKRDANQDRLFDYLAQAMIAQRQKAMGYDDEDLFDDLDAKQKGRLAAKWMLSVPDSVKDVKTARAEALRILGAMLGNDVSVIKSLLTANLEVVVIPRDQGMTVLDQFKELAGTKTFDGRSWDSVRGVGNVKNKSALTLIKERKELKKEIETGKGPSSIVAIDPMKGKIYTAITEENLLGGLTTSPGGGCYATGYSTTTHEFAHSVHQYGLSDGDRAEIKTAYEARLAQPDTVQWVDGPRKFNGQTCYAAMTINEYFAQLSNAWLGVNIGTDPYTRQPRNNGKQWVLSNEPRKMCDILERVYGKTALDDLNPAVILKS